MKNWKWQERYLDLAEEISKWSKDPSTQCGAVAVGDKGQILSQGYNGFPRGINDNLGLLKDKSCLGVIQVGIERVVMRAPKLPERWSESWELSKKLLSEANVKFDLH